MATVLFTLDTSRGDARLLLYTEASDTVAETITAIVQETNRKGLYIPTVTEVGLRYCVIVDDATGTEVWGWGWVNIKNATGSFGVTIDREASNHEGLADTILNRNVSNVEATADEHTLCTSILAGLEWSVSGTTLTIKRTDGSTTHYTKTLTTDAAAEPVTSAN